MVEKNSERQETREIVEEAREAGWKYPSFAGQLFLGRLRADLIFPYAVQSEEDRRIGDAFMLEVESFLKSNLDPDEVDRTGEMPKAVIEGLVRLGCFGMKIPKEYGGLGFSQVNYNRVISLIGSYCGSTSVWLSAHQSIGVPNPLKLFGTEEQKRRYLPRLAQGAISAFALTEPDVGSDPARMKATAIPVDGGDFYLLNGEKLWCTNGPVADIIIVMAQTPEKIIHGRPQKQITAFIVESSMPGVKSTHRCDFMGLKGIQNGLLRFENVKVPEENILWGLGQGLKLALITLNTGRLTLPAVCVGASKLCLQICRHWANERVQWGLPIGQHEAIASKLAWMAGHIFAMESVSSLTSAWADRGDMDIRLEAAMAKLFASETAWRIGDEALQIRGGRGYETADSLRGRGEAAYPIERIVRDLRINLIIEGTSEIMRLFIAREALDPHVNMVMDIIKPRQRLLNRVRYSGKAACFYACWYPGQWIPVIRLNWPIELDASLCRHMRFVERTSQRLARTIFHFIVRKGERLEKCQQLLFRLVNIGIDLFAISASCSRASMLLKSDPQRREPIKLADLFCQQARRRISQQFSQLLPPDDRHAYHIAQDILKGHYTWLEDGIIDSK